MEKRKRCDHIHRCRRQKIARDLGVLPFDLKFCYFCMDFYTEHEWEQDCQGHLSRPLKQCSSLTYRSTLVRPAFCMLCKQAEHLSGIDRLRYWERDKEAIRHIEEYHGWRWYCAECEYSCDGRVAGYHHLHDAHGYSCKTSTGMRENHLQADSPGESGLGTEYESPLPQADTVNPAELHPDDDIIDKLMADFISFPPTPQAVPAAADLEPLAESWELNPEPDQADKVDLKKEDSPSLAGAMDKHKQRHVVRLSRNSPPISFRGPDLESSSNGSESAPITPPPNELQTELSVDVPDPLCDVARVMQPAAQCIGLAPAGSHFECDVCPNVAKPRIKLRMRSPVRSIDEYESLQSTRGRKRLPRTRRKSSSGSPSQTSVDTPRRTAKTPAEAAVSTTNEQRQRQRLRVILRRKGPPIQDTEDDSEKVGPPRRRPRIILHRSSR
jgi:hypothetical protein